MTDKNVKNWALIKDDSGLVLNIVLWDKSVEMDFGKGVTPVEIGEEDRVSPGFTYSEGKFIAPPLTAEQEETKKNSILDLNGANKRIFMSNATLRISILQDAVDLEMATDEEIKLLPLWKKYRVLLSRIDANTTDEISWPALPE